MADFAAVHDRLRAILPARRGDPGVTKDGPAGVTIEVPGLEGKPWGYVAGTRVGKSYVSYYLMPVYVSTELSASVSPALQRRKQGKACFNFTRIDEALLTELDELTAKGLRGYRAWPRRPPPGRR